MPCELHEINFLKKTNIYLKYKKLTFLDPLFTAKTRRKIFVFVFMFVL